MTGDVLTLIPDAAPAGYVFDCWRNSKGEKVENHNSITGQIVVTVPGPETYQAYYKPMEETDVKDPVENQICYDVNDWQ